MFVCGDDGVIGYGHFGWELIHLVSGKMDKTKLREIQCSIYKENEPVNKIINGYSLSNTIFKISNLQEELINVII